MNILVKVPATTANLGPGFDVLGLALDLWNRAEFSLEGRGVHVEISGEGRGRLATDGRNWMAHGARRVYEAAETPFPSGLTIRCENSIPLGSGLGSSAAACLAGLLGANALLGTPFSPEDILQLAIQLEGHPDNAAPALFGGLVAAAQLGDGQIVARRLPVRPLLATVVVPDFHFPTRQARTALPKQVPLQAAVHNMSRTLLVTQALAEGDLSLLGMVMDDLLHQPYRLPLIPGAGAAMQAGRQAGADAVALSGAGPSLIAFSAHGEPAIGEAMTRAFASAGLTARVLSLQISQQGAEVRSAD